MMKLYHSAQSRSMRPRWLLEEIGAPYELVRVSLEKGDTKKPEYLKLNPNGRVPTLVDGDLVLWESAGICQYLADKFPEKKLAPAPGTPARGLYYQWILYTMTELEPPLVAIFLHTIRRPEAERMPAVAVEARTQLQPILDVIERALGGRDFILGSEFSAADVMLGSTLVWAQMMNLLGEGRPAITGYLGRMASRPAAQRAMAD